MMHYALYGNHPLAGKNVKFDVREDFEVFASHWLKGWQWSMCMVKVGHHLDNKKEQSKKQASGNSGCFFVLEVRSRDKVYVTRNFHSIKKRPFYLPALCESSSNPPKPINSNSS